MTAKPRKALLVNLTWAAALLVGFPAAYVASFCFAYWLVGIGAIGFPTVHTLEETVYRPLSWYMGEEWPGSLQLERATKWCQLKGMGHTGAVDWGELGLE